MRKFIDVPEDVHDEGEDSEHLEEEEDLGGHSQHVVLVEVVQQILVIRKLCQKHNFRQFMQQNYCSSEYRKKGGSYNCGDYVGVDVETDILNAALGEGEGNVEGGSDEHVRRRHQDVSQAHVPALP